MEKFTQSITVNYSLIGEKAKMGITVDYKEIEVIEAGEVIYSHKQKQEHETDSTLMCEIEKVLGFKKGKVSGNRCSNSCNLFKFISKCWFKCFYFSK